MMMRARTLLASNCPAFVARRQTHGLWRLVLWRLVLWRLLGALGLLTASLAASGQPVPQTPKPANAMDSKPAAKAPVLLTISGALKAGPGKTVQLDLAQLSALPQQQLHTQTPWYPAPRTFSGPLLQDVLNLAGAQGQTLEARAINDYKVNIPVSDAARFKPVLALQIDGKPIALRDKGPLFIVYPYDSDPQLRSSVYYSRSIWQLKSLEVR